MQDDLRDLMPSLVHRMSSKTVGYIQRPCISMFFWSKVLNCILKFILCERVSRGQRQLVGVVLSSHHVVLRDRAQVIIRLFQLSHLAQPQPFPRQSLGPGLHQTQRAACPFLPAGVPVTGGRRTGWSSLRASVLKAPGMSCGCGAWSHSVWHLSVAPEWHVWAAPGCASFQLLRQGAELAAAAPPGWSAHR